MVIHALLLVLWGALAFLYARGWWRLRRRGARRLAHPWRLLVAALAWTAFVLAVVSPIAKYEARSFFVHMIQHELLIEVAAPLVWLALPVPFWLWGMPRGLRRWWIRTFLAPQSAWRRRAQPWTAPKVIVPLYLGVVTAWHLPPLFDAALRVPGLHFLEHASLWMAAWLYWWLVMAAPPRWHGYGRGQLPLVYVIIAYLHNEVLGVGLTLIREPLYGFYAYAQPPWNLSPLADQALGGAVMWIPGEFIYATTLIGLLMRLLEEEEPYHEIFETYPSA